MKKFRTNISASLFFLILGLFLLSFLLFPGYFGIKLSSYEFAGLVFGVLLLLMMGFFLLTMFVVIDDNELIYYDFFRKESRIRWENLKIVESVFYFDPSLCGYLSLLSIIDGNFVRIPVSFFKIELVKEILEHVPKGIEVNLYTYLKRKIEGKQTWFFKEHY